MNYYTDGSADDKYAAYAVINEEGKLVTGGRILGGTSQAGEFQGILTALNLAKDGDHIYTDSNYVTQTYNLWMEGWKICGWKRQGKQVIANLDMVKELYEIKQKKPNTRITWIKRSSRIQNKIADKFAYEILKKGIDSVAETV